MMVSIDRATLVQLTDAPLFQACGRAVPDELGVQLSTASWSAARDAILDPAWEALRQEVTGETTSHLFRKHPGAYHGVWNSLVDEAKGHIEPIVSRAAAFIPDAESRAKILDDVRWDLLMGAMETTYARYGVPCFYRLLWKVYVAGHLPCGWQGVPQTGRPVVF